MRVKPGLALVAASIGLAVQVGCGESTSPPANGDLPPLLSQLTDGSGEHAYEPRWKLWTNGSVKQRSVNLTEGGEISTTDRTRWSYPEGTRFLKTFAYYTQASPTTLVPVETRVIRRRNGQWETGVYVWRGDGSDAELETGTQPVRVPITDKDGRTFDHEVPGRGQCQVCHGSNTTFIIGFSELQLNAPFPGEGATQLDKFFQQGILGGTAPATPAEVPSPDAMTMGVLGYVQGNCVHCHNTNSSLDLTPATFFAKTVDQPSPFGGALPLIRPQLPDSSLIYVRFSTGVMPALGVQLGDSAARAMMRNWIMTHNFTN